MGLELLQKKYKKNSKIGNTITYIYLDAVVAL